MKTTLLTFLLLTSTAFASPINLKCTSLLNGNDSRKASQTIKSIDLTIALDVQSDVAILQGTVTKERNHSYDDKQAFYEGFMDYKKMSQKDNIITVKSHDESILLCSLAHESICHSWSNLTVNVKTGEALYEEFYSMNSIFIKKEQAMSIRFNCSLE